MISYGEVLLEGLYGTARIYIRWGAELVMDGGNGYSQIQTRPVLVLFVSISCFVSMAQREFIFTSGRHLRST